MKFNVGDKIKMVKQPNEGWYGDKSNPVKVGDILTIKKMSGRSYEFYEIPEDGWICIDECFINISNREKKLKRICDEI